MESMFVSSVHSFSEGGRIDGIVFLNSLHSLVQTAC